MDGTIDEHWFNKSKKEKIESLKYKADRLEGRIEKVEKMLEDIR